MLRRNKDPLTSVKLPVSGFKVLKFGNDKEARWNDSQLVYVPFPDRSVTAPWLSLSLFVVTKSEIKKPKIFTLTHRAILKESSCFIGGVILVGYPVAGF